MNFTYFRVSLRDPKRNKEISEKNSVLSRSNRLMRCMADEDENVDKKKVRLWRMESEKNACGATPLDKQQILAEISFILQPIVHLTSMGIFGFKSWKPWVLSALCDIFR